MKKKIDFRKKQVYYKDKKRKNNFNQKLGNHYVRNRQNGKNIIRIK